MSSRGAHALVRNNSPSPAPIRRLPSPAISEKGEGDNKKMKSLFKSKPKTPVDLVRQTRDLLVYADLGSDSRESKREEKVR